MIAGHEWSDPKLRDTRASLEQAKLNLKSYFVVGLTEEFDASVRLMSQRFGWKVKSYAKKNVTRTKPRDDASDASDAETLALLRAANALDIELYRFARELFQAQQRGEVKNSPPPVLSR